MDEQSGESKEEEVMGEGVGEQEFRKWRNWYHNEVDKEIKGVGSRDKVKHRWDQGRTNPFTAARGDELAMQPF